MIILDQVKVCWASENIWWASVFPIYLPGKKYLSSGKTPNPGYRPFIHVLNCTVIIVMLHYNVYYSRVRVEINSYLPVTFVFFSTRQHIFNGNIYSCAHLGLLRSEINMIRTQQTQSNIGLLIFGWG